MPRPAKDSQGRPLVTVFAQLDRETHEAMTDAAWTARLTRKDFVRRAIEQAIERDKEVTGK